MCIEHVSYALLLSQSGTIIDETSKTYSFCPITNLIQGLLQVTLDVVQTAILGNSGKSKEVFLSKSYYVMSL